MSPDVRSFFASIRPSYRTYRRLGFARHRAAQRALTPHRVTIAWAALHGRPVAYRLHIKDGGLVFENVRGGAVISCVIESPRLWSPFQVVSPEPVE